MATYNRQQPVVRDTIHADKSGHHKQVQLPMMTSSAVQFHLCRSTRYLVFKCSPYIAPYNVVLALLKGFGRPNMGQHKDQVSSLLSG